MAEIRDDEEGDRQASAMESAACSGPEMKVQTPPVPRALKCSWCQIYQSFAKMKLSLAILVVFLAVSFAAPIISTANKVAVNFYMESL
jgi:hypothetical protein